MADSQGAVQKIDEKTKLKVYKFTQKIHERYGNRDMTIAEITRKALKHKSSQGLNDSEFNLFTEYLPHIMNKMNAGDKFQFSTPFSKKLGKITPSKVHMAGRLKIEGEDERKALSLIKKHAMGGRQLHHAVTAQSLVYTGPHHLLDVAYSRTRREVTPDCHLHPVVAAMFLNKVGYFDNRVLYSSLARIIADREANRAPMFEPDYRFLIDLTRSTSDMLCHKKSLMHDLLQRVVMQEKLRELVLKFRSGVIYDESYRTFMQLVNSCSMSSYDAPHFLYFQDEGAVMRKLMEMFCMRPLKIVTRPTHPGLTGPGVMPYAMQKIVERGSMHVRIPFTHPNQSVSSSPAANFWSTLRVPEWISVGGRLQSRHHDLLYSQGPIVFYVNRRSAPIAFMNPMANYTRFAISQPAGIERLNPYPVDCQPTLSHPGGVALNYSLVSAVAVKTFVLNPLSAASLAVVNNENIIGSRTFFSVTDGNTDSTNWWCYDPVNVLRQLTAPRDSTSNDTPRDPIRARTDAAANGEPFTNWGQWSGDGARRGGVCAELQTRGTIFVYNREM